MIIIVQLLPTAAGRVLGKSRVETLGLIGTLATLDYLTYLTYPRLALRLCTSVQLPIIRDGANLKIFHLSCYAGTVDLLLSSLHLFLRKS